MKTYDEIKEEVKEAVKKAESAAKKGAGAVKAEFETLKKDIDEFKNAEETKARKEAWKETFKSLKGAAKETWDDLSDSVKREINTVFKSDDDDDEEEL